MTDRESLDISVLISRAIEGSLSEAEYEELNRRMEDPEVRQAYFELLKVDLALRDVGTHELAMGEGCEQVLAPEFWDQLARAEQCAPAVEIFEEDKRREPVARVTYERAVRRVNKVSLAAALAALAAMLFLLVFVQMGTMPVETATVADAFQARWAGEGPVTGSRLSLSADTLALQSGVVKLESDEGVEILIEGPAEFRFSGTSAMEMKYGRLFARVRPAGIGFSVTTPVSRIVDLGTEFGIRTEIGGDTELHVFKGKTSLLRKESLSIAGDQTVSEGQAKSIGDGGQTVREIVLQRETFIEDIDSEHHWILRGQRRIELADIVGGGNGLGTGKADTGIDPISGKSCGHQDFDRWAEGNTYVRSEGHLFVDGVFVPSGVQPQVISSSGHVFKECPVTEGVYFTDILNSPSVIDFAPIQMGGIDYGPGLSRCIFLHANLGITFNLDQVRGAVSKSGLQVRRFESQAGISGTARRDCNADLWVLVDGKVRYHRSGIRQKGISEPVVIELSEGDRFLTLVATDGGDAPRLGEYGRIEQSIDSDWCVFGSPALVLE